MSLLLLFFIILLQNISSNTIATSSPNTYFKPDLKRVESRLTGAQVLVLQESDSQRSLNNPYLSKSNGYSADTRIVDQVKVSLNQILKSGNTRRPIKFNRLKSGNYKLLVKTESHQLSLTFALKWEEEILCLIFIPKGKKSPLLAMIQPKKVLAGVEFRKMLNHLKHWHQKLIKLENLRTDFKPMVHNSYMDEFGKKEDLVDFLSIWQKKVKILQAESLVIQPNQNRLRSFLKFNLEYDDVKTTKCFKLILNETEQLSSYEILPCSQSGFSKKI